MRMHTADRNLKVLKPSLYTHVHILWALKVQSEIKNSQVLN